VADSIIWHVSEYGFCNGSPFWTDLVLAYFLTTVLATLWWSY